MQVPIVAYGLAWTQGKEGQPRGGFVKLKLADQSDQTVRVTSPEELMALHELLRSTRPVLWDDEQNFIITPMQSL